MKPALLKNIESTTAALTIQELEEPHFDPNWHFHPHYQLFTVLEGTGSRLIGDSKATKAFGKSHQKYQSKHLDPYNKRRQK